MNLSAIANSKGPAYLKCETKSLKYGARPAPQGGSLAIMLSLLFHDKAMTLSRSKGPALQPSNTKLQCLRPI